MCVFDNPPTLCDQICGHLTFKYSLSHLIGIVETMPPLPCSNDDEITIEELIIRNEKLTKEIQQQNKTIEETLEKIQSAIHQHK